MKNEILAIAAFMTICVVGLYYAPSPEDPGMKAGLALVSLSNSEGFELLDENDIRLIADAKLTDSPLPENQKIKMINSFLEHVRKTRESRSIAGKSF